MHMGLQAVRPPFLAEVTRLYKQRFELVNSESARLY